MHMACRLRRAWHGFCTVAQMGAEARVAEQHRPQLHRCTWNAGCTGHGMAFAQLHRHAGCIGHSCTIALSLHRPQLDTAFVRHPHTSSSAASSDDFPSHTLGVSAHLAALAVVPLSSVVSSDRVSNHALGASASLIVVAAAATAI